MKIIENNLKNFIDIPLNVLEVTNSYITEVDSFGPVTNINNLVIGHVMSKVKHEDADTLSVLQVDLGTKVQQIVCGASNVDVGQYVIVATEGAVLPGDFVIKKSKIRGVESNGMVCSLNELGIDESLVPNEFKEGIYYFDSKKEVGTNALIHLGMDGFVMELDLTPNRSDLLSHYGYAKDLAAALNTKVNLPKVDDLTKGNSNINNPLEVVIESKNTNSYYAAHLTDIKIADSPWWLKSFLLASDCQPINNVVDITNYILYTYGIPMHAFDYDSFGGNTIVIKDNDKKQEVVTLMDQKIELTNNEIIITNGKDIKALGGIMGLKNSMITDNTKSVILEVASFNNQVIRSSSKNLGLRSDSSLRFERGIDEQIMDQALKHALMLLIKYADAKVSKGIASQVVDQRKNPAIEIDVLDISNKIGTVISKEEIIDILTRLEYIISDTKESLKVTAPSYRTDILKYYDVLEEVVRIYGMDKVENVSLKASGLGSLTSEQKLVRRLRHYLANLGLNEVVTYSLLKEINVNRFNTLGEVINVLKPLTVDRKSMRQSLVNGLLDTVNYNRARSIKDVNLFEIGHVYAKGIENNALSVALTSRLTTNLWKKEETEIDFFYASGLLANIMDIINVDFNLKPSNYEAYHPHQQADILVNGKNVGIIGKIHPLISKRSTFVFEINLDLITKTKKFKYETISKYPNVERDLALVIKEDIPVDEVVRLITQTAKKQLVSIKMFDLYTGSHIDEGFKSVAFNLTFNDSNKTLEGSDIDKIITRIVKRIEFEIDGKIRS